MDNWFRGPRRISDIYRALHQHGVVLPKYSPQFRDIDVTPMADPFTRCTPNGMAASHTTKRSRRWRRTGWRECCPAPSTPTYPLP